MKLYTNRSNCMRAAKVALGLGAILDTHFTITKTDDVLSDVGDNHTVTPGGFRFDAIDGAPAVPAVEAKVTVAKPAKVKAAKAPKATKAKKAKAPKAARKPNDGTVGHQPSHQRLIALATRVSGVSNEDAATRLKLKNHTVRAMFSNLEKEYKFDKEKVNGKIVRSNPRKLRGAAHEGVGLGEPAQAAQ